VPTSETVLVDFFYAQQVGHAIEALHHALAVHAADPTRQVSVLLNAATPTELAGCCPFLTACHAVDAPFLEPDPDADASLAHVPQEWDWVLDDPRRHQPFQLDAFPGMRDHYAASDRRFTARLGRRPLGYPPPSRARHQQLRLELPAGARAAADVRVAGLGDQVVTLMPAGSSASSGYPSARSWLDVLDGLHAALPGVRVVLVGRTVRDERTASGFERTGWDRLADHGAVAGTVLDVPLLEQLAVVERSALFLAPHTGFGMAALAVGTPWLSVSGGRWFEWYANQVPFRSVVPDTRRFPCFSRFAADVATPDGDDGDRIPSMTRARIAEDLPRIVTAAGELLRGAVPYEQCLDDYYRDLLRALDGDASAIFSFDDVHREHLPRPVPD
jgi:hypothetical protein